MSELLHWPWEPGYSCDHSEDHPSHDWAVPEDIAVCFRCGVRSGAHGGGLAAFVPCPGPRPLTEEQGAGEENEDEEVHGRG